VKGGESGNVDASMPSEAQVGAAVAAFALLADPTRLRLLWLLHAKEYDVGALARLTGSTSQATSQHLAKLRLAGLVSARRQGRQHIYTARDTHVRRLVREALHHADHQLSGQPDHD
jgi:DNA-binding transcriptional ArsR family regulator